MKSIKCRHSIKRQYPIIFGLLLFGAIVLISFFNFVFLGRFYTYHKEKVLLDSYKTIDSAAVSGTIESSDFDQTLKTAAAINNVDVLIIDSDTETIKSTEIDARPLTSKLLEYVFKGTGDNALIYSDDKAQILRTKDKSLGLEFLELWGVLSTGELILLRTPIQSIQEAASLANRLLFLCGFGISLLGFTVIWMVSSRLTKPIMNLVAISEKMTQLDFSQKYVNTGENEIDELGSHINILSDNLEKTIVELKSANNELQKDIAKKTEVDEMRKDFISNVSHELKTPIALIQGYAEGLKDCVADDEESRAFYCDVIMDEASRMNKLVRSLLDLIEIESGLNNVEIAHFDIIELICNCALSFEILMKNESITLKLPQNGPIYVWADEFKVEQILTNYISNAMIHASMEKIIDIKVVKSDNIARISVFNTGSPIPQEEIPNLWTKFYKIDKARTRRYGGSGIGLSIVKASMDAMGHAYGVENHENGVEFWFELDANAK